MFLEICIPEIMINPEKNTFGAVQAPRGCAPYTPPTATRFREATKVGEFGFAQSPVYIPWNGEMARQPFMRPVYSAPFNPIPVVKHNNTALNRPESLCNFQLINKSFALNFAAGCSAQEKLQNFFEGFEETSAMGLETTLWEEGRAKTFSYSPSLSSFELEINNFDSFFRIMKEIKETHHCHKEAIEAHLNQLADNFGQRLLLQLCPDLKLLVVGNVMRFLFYESRPSYGREVLSDKLDLLFESAPYLRDIKMREINFFSSYFAVLYSPLNKDRSVLGEASFLTFYSFNTPQAKSRVEILPVGTMPIKLPESYLTDRVTGDMTSNNYFREILNINNVSF